MRSKGLLALCLSALCLTGAASAEITLSGTVVARETAAVTADVGGAVEEVYVREGEWIEAGDAVASIAVTGVYAPADGTVRGVLAEVQALVTPTGFGNPRRMSNGIDLNRVILLIAVLEKRAGMNLSNSDVYINVAGGLRIDEPAADLGICAAIAASQSDTLLPPDMIFLGEVGLGGELRAVSQLEKRLAEAAKLGFSTAIVPKRSLGKIQKPDGIVPYGVSDVREVMTLLRKKK